MWWNDGAARLRWDADLTIVLNVRANTPYKSPVKIKVRLVFYDAEYRSGSRPGCLAEEGSNDHGRAALRPRCLRKRATFDGEPKTIIERYGAELQIGDHSDSEYPRLLGRAYVVWEEDDLPGRDLMEIGRLGGAGEAGGRNVAQNNGRTLHLP